MDTGILEHRGVAHDDGPPGRGSGRYGWGTGENPGQHDYSFTATVKRMREKGLSNAEIAKALLGEHATTTQLKVRIGIEEKEERRALMERAAKLYDEYGNYSEVGRRMGKSESTIRSLLDPVKAERTLRYENTAEMLKEAIKKNGWPMDVGAGTEIHLGCTKTTKDTAIAMLEAEGYVKTKISIPTGPNTNTVTVVLAPPGTLKSDIQKNKFDLKQVLTFTPDEGKTWWVPEFPSNLDSKRVYVRYKEEGGSEKDGVIELRPGVEDINLGGPRYAQVRIAVDGTNYLKGMAIYSDDIPKGYDVVYNTNKKKGVPLIDKDATYDSEKNTWHGSEVAKRLKINPATGEVDQDNPFGALIKGPKDRDGVVSAGGQRKYIGKDGKEYLSPVNRLQDEGDWDSWSRNLSSQFLSKQPLKLIDQQINLSIASKRNELDEIMALTNPVIKKKLLQQYADSCDSNASSLSVKGFKNQAFQVLLPITDLKDNEIYAPNYKDGDTVVLVRYPHGGIFEIPVLKVNNRQETAKKVIGDSRDAVGINSKTAEILSGADFDGDTALVIPVASNRLGISHSKQLDALKGFDPKALYKLPDDAPKMNGKTKQIEMGQVSNLITDMTVAGATPSEIARAVKHSMVVIDAEKHHLDYKQSAKDNNIRALKKEYQEIVDEQGKSHTGASTILSRAGAQARTDTRKEVTNTKIMTPEELERWNKGYKVWRSKGETLKEKITDPKKMTSEELELFNSGKSVYRDSGKPKTIKVTQMDLVDDAMDLVRNKDNPKEVAYANYANSLKALALEARRESRSIQTVPASPSAKKIYSKEVEDLKKKLEVAESNSPKERQARALANSMASEKFRDNPHMEYEQKQREQARCLTVARAIVGAKKDPVKITDKEWEAIQANAVSSNLLSRILDNTDQEAFKQRATPKNYGSTLTASQINFIKAMKATGMYTQADIADALGISTSTVSNALKE